MKYLILLTMIICTNAQALTEKQYVANHCSGRMEVVLPDRTRVDCETSEYAIEYDLARKWAESIGQSLHYAKMTGKIPGIVLITETEKDCKYVARTKAVLDRFWLRTRLQTTGAFRCEGY